MATKKQPTKRKPTKKQRTFTVQEDDKVYQEIQNDIIERAKPDKYFHGRITKDFPIALGNAVIVLPGINEEIVQGGLIIPETDDSMKMRGTIMAVGPEVKRTFFDLNGIKRLLRPNDKVIFNLYSNLTITHKNISYLMHSELDIYAVLPDNTNVSTVRHKSRKGIKDHREV